MKRRKTKTDNIQEVHKEIVGFLKKYDYITSDDRLSNGAIRLMLLIIL